MPDAVFFVPLETVMRLVRACPSSSTSRTTQRVPGFSGQYGLSTLVVNSLGAGTGLVTTLGCAVVALTGVESDELAVSPQPARPASSRHPPAATAVRIRIPRL